VLTGNIPQQDLVNISLADFEKLSMKVISSSIDERRDVKGIPENRVKFIQVAFIMMRKIIDMYAPDQIGVSPFAIKEGLISEWLTE
jgi:exopolyphosphatase/pppGpp-phosphohydrolase